MTKLIILAGISQPVNIDAPIYAGSHFTWAEATKNGTRLPVNTTIGGVLVPAANITANIIKIAKELDRIRADFGNVPITVTSWYRDPRSNKAVGGVSNSQHLYGWAVDIQIAGVSPATVARKLAPTWKGGLGDSDSFTHLDLRHLLGWQAARWDYGNA